MVLRQGMTLALTGLTLGTACAYALSRILQSMLFSITPTDPLTFLAVGLVLGLVGMLACYVPARRATRVDPLVALRSQ